MRSDWYLFAAVIAGVSAAVSAWAAVSIRNLTKKLVNATEEYANAVHEELVLLRREAEPRLFLDARIIPQYPYNHCQLTCIHLGAAGSPPVLIECVETVLESLDSPAQTLESDTAKFHDLLAPGKRWCKIVTGRVGLKLVSLKRPNIFEAFFRWRWKRRLAAYLLIRLHYRVADEQRPPVEKQFQVLTTPTGEFLRPVV